MDEALEEARRGRVAAGRAAWPAVVLDPACFVRFLAERTRGDEAPPVALDADLYIACACAHGVPGAVDAFECEFKDVLVRACTRQDRDGAFVEEAMQALRERLFVGSPDRGPRIADYAGRAPLRSWLAAAASRLVIDLRRRAQARREEASSGSQLVVTGATPVDLQYLRARYRDAIKDSVRCAFGRLSDKQRALLQLNIAEGMSIDHLARLYRVGRSTAARWLSAARSALREETRREICARLHLPSSEYDSLAAAVKSDLDMSVASLFAR